MLDFAVEAVELGANLLGIAELLAQTDQIGEVLAAKAGTDAVALALASAPVVEALAGRSPKRVIARPPKLVNVVV